MNKETNKWTDERDNLVQNQREKDQSRIGHLSSTTLLPFFFLSPVFQEGLGWNYTWMVEGGSTAKEGVAFLFNALYIKPLWNDLQKILPIQIEEEKKQERISMSAR